MIVNNQNQKWETHEVALCHVWDCDRLLRLDQCHTYVKPEWFGQPWAHGLDVVAICAHHIVGKDERILVANDKPKPLSSPESLQELSDILGDDGAVFAGNTETGTWGHVEPVQHFDAEELKKLEPRVQDKEELKDFVFRHEVIDGNDFLYQEWLMDINEGRI